MSDPLDESISSASNRCEPPMWNGSTQQKNQPIGMDWLSGRYNLMKCALSTRSRIHHNPEEFMEEFNGDSNVLFE